MPLPLLLKLGAAGLGFWALSKKQPAGPSSPNDPRAVPSPTSTPVALRMAQVLATGDTAAIRFEAGRLRQEGYPEQANTLDREAAKLDAERAAAAKPPAVGPLPAGATKSPGFVPPVVKPAAPPIVIQTPAGPIAVPAPPVTLDKPAAPPIVVQTPAGQVTVPGELAGTLPQLAAGAVLHYIPPPAPFDPRVKLWQLKLLSLGISVGKDGADGKFGADTRAATEQFQRLANQDAATKGLPLVLVNGMLDGPTLARAATVFALPTAAAPTPAPPPAPPTAGLPLPQLGAKEVLKYIAPPAPFDPRVQLWQLKLLSLGISVGKDGADGKFGTDTKSATKKFQELANKAKRPDQSLLSVDGVVGPGTIARAALAVPGSGGAVLFGDVGLPGFSLPGVALAFGSPAPASPLPGVLPNMAPKPIEPRMALASRLAHNLTLTQPGQEDRQLVQLFQMQEGLKPSGLYNASTAAALGASYGIIPPKPRYWTGTGTRKSKQNYAAKMRELGARDRQRFEEWQQAGSNL